MTAKREIDVEARLVSIKYHGDISMDDIRKNREALSSEPDFDSSYNMLVDMTEVSSFQLSSNEARQMAKSTIFSKSSKIGIVVNSDFHFGIARMFQSNKGAFGDRTLVFREMSEARRWIASDLD
jgi:hypothetical protein